MTPAEHAQEAERLLASAVDYTITTPLRADVVARAQVHATLSLRKATPAKRTTTKKSTTNTKEKSA